MDQQERIDSLRKLADLLRLSASLLASLSTTHGDLADELRKIAVSVEQIAVAMLM